AAAGSIVTIYDGAVVIGSVTADSKGTWFYDIARALADGRHTFTVTATNAAGNTSSHSGDFVLNVDAYVPDTTPPDAPVITEVYDDVGTQKGPVANHGKTDDSQPLISGTAEKNSVVTIKAHSPAGTDYTLGSAVTDNAGHWSYQLHGTQSITGIKGDWTFTAQAADAAGNKSGWSTGYTVESVGSNQDDTSVPGTPTITDYYDDVGDSKGDFKSGTTTDDSTPELKGHADAGSIVKVYEGSTLLGSTTAHSDGSWSFTPSARPDGKHTFFATATNAAGHTSGHSGDFVVTVDTTPPGPPHVSGIEHFGDASNEKGYSFTTAAGVKVESNIYLDQRLQPGTLVDGLGSQYYVTGDTDGGINFNVTLPGVADIVTICGMGGDDNRRANDVTFYNAEGHVISVSTSYGSDGGLINFPSTIFTANGGETIASFTCHNLLYMASIKWESTVTSTYHEPLVHQVAYQDDAQAGHESVLTLAQIDDSHKSTAAVDITDHVQNTLHLTLNDILSEAHPNLFVQDGKQQLAVTGDQGDVVELKVDDLAHNTWQDSGAVTAGGIQYEVYQHAGSDVELLVQHGLELHQVS
ncbi:Ig-like domain-containing protein, partial [Rahnella woolbedingensis]